MNKNVDIQRALLENMPMTALIRNLGAMTSSGLLKPLSDEVSLVIDKITDEEALKISRIHPMSVLMALKTYASGSSMTTDNWNPISDIREALEDAFYSSFSYVERTGKKHLFGIDVSGSMAWSALGDSGLTPREAAAVIAMTYARTEENYDMMAFSSGLVDLHITATDSLDTVIRKTSTWNGGATDCTLLIRYAIDYCLDVDVFVTLTDNETWCGNGPPFKWLKKYRKKFNKDAKMAVLAFSSNGFTIADPSDAGMMNIAGLDANVPKTLSSFASGRF